MIAWLKDFALRAATAAVGIPVAIVLIYFQGGVYFAAAMAVFALAGWGEYVMGTRRAGFAPLTVIGGIVLVAGLCWVAHFPWVRHIGSAEAMAIIGFLTVVVATFLWHSDSPVRTAGSTLLGIGYILWTFGFAIYLRGVNLSNVPEPRFAPPL